ncbi:sugar transferase [Edaphobacter sp. 12200R-103]|uniref:sugar transferase n=1 Tax=Edaphobacter sp. 12200R-103 TaxID=2703788 RepID=UPI00192EE45A|nr:sugar transferase [Edaphobacter sp. 12200R-103]
MSTQKSDLLAWSQEAEYDTRTDITFDLEQESVISEAAFLRMLRLERRRTERSERSFMLVLVHCGEFSTKAERILLEDVVVALTGATRETDLLGWYETGSTLGLLMTEIGEPNTTTVEKITHKIRHAVEREIVAEEYRKLTFQFRLFPQDVQTGIGEDGQHVHYPDIFRPSMRRVGGGTNGRFGRFLKRGMDLVGSLFALMVFMPLCVTIAVIVKLTSKGPVLFCQKRMGQYGREFNFYKFRTMYTGNDPRIHQEYVSRLISGDLGKSEGVFKMTNDPRITPIGRFLRKSSLDELPQFFNVLKGDMSLVGPRPPLMYEFERYQTWHRRRVFEIKPGLTGLWQVTGRSRTTFDEMVRMDLRYAVERSFWFDVKILLRTPAAMFSGRGAC